MKQFNYFIKAKLPLFLIFSALLHVFTFPVYSQDMSYSKPGQMYYTEMENPAATDLNEWASVKKDINVSFADDNTRFPKEKVPKIPLTKEWNVKSWKGEKIHTQVLLWTKKDIQNVSFIVRDLVNQNGERIKKELVKPSFIRYVMTDEFGRGCDRRKTTDYDSSLVADPLDLVESLAVKKNCVQPVWLSISVPDDIPAGTYSGIITVKANKKFNLKININVLQHVLPAADKWVFDLDLWQNAHSIAMVHDVPLWSDEHFNTMKPYFTMLSAAGQKVITANIIEQPWGPDHIYYRDPSLVKWIKKKDGSWQYDYTLFDRYISFMMECGINKRINCYSMVTWDLLFIYYDEAKGQNDTLITKPGTVEYKQFWEPMITDFTAHLKEKGWFEKTLIAMDERSLESMSEVISLLKNVDNEWKTSLAGNYHPEIEKDIYDYCLVITHNFSENSLKERKDQGRPSTFYTCCGQKYPNSFSFSPPAENVWIGWYTHAAGFTGYLRWAYNNWTEAPLLDTRYKTWPAADCYMIYMGPRSSIRFEKLIEGIQDYEKVRILKEEFKKNGNDAALKELEQVLSVFKFEKLENTPAEEMLIQGKAFLNKY